MARTAGWDALAAHLRSNAGADDLDDAVRGALDVDALLEDFDIPAGDFHRRMAWREINAALADEATAA